MKQLLMVVILMFVLGSNNLAVAEGCDQECQKSVIETYFTQLAEIYRKGSTEADIDKLFGMLHQNVRYEHKTYDANFDCAGWRDAFVNNLKRGAYNKTMKDVIRIDQYIHGNNYAAVSYSYGLIDNSGVWQPSGDQELMAVFKFTDKQISLVQEYW